MNAIESFEQLETFGRTRLSQHFFMRDFLHSEIASWHQLRNVPDHPDAAIRIGRRLCEELLEPLQATFGRIHVRSGYRSPLVNAFGNENDLNCASNAANFAAHIWDHPDAHGRYGATACIVVPWLADHVASGGRWTDMAWWIHDHLPYSALYFFPKLSAFNINYHEAPLRRIDSYVAPRGCLTKPGMSNHAGSHAHEYEGFPALVDKAAKPAMHWPADAAMERLAPPSISNLAAREHRQDNPKVYYRAVHAKTPWRKVSSHHSVDAALHGDNGARALFAHRARIDYDRHGEPLFVLVWQDGAVEGVVVVPASDAGAEPRQITVPVEPLLEFERQGAADCAWLERLATH